MGRFIQRSDITTVGTDALLHIGVVSIFIPVKYILS